MPEESNIKRSTQTKKKDDDDDGGAAMKQSCEPEQRPERRFPFAHACRTDAVRRNFPPLTSLRTCLPSPPTWVVPSPFFGQERRRILPFSTFLLWEDHFPFFP